MTPLSTTQKPNAQAFKQPHFITIFCRIVDRYEKFGELVIGYKTIDGKDDERVYAWRFNESTNPNYLLMSKLKVGSKYVVKLSRMGDCITFLTTREVEVV